MEKRIEGKKNWRKELREKRIGGKKNWRKELREKRIGMQSMGRKELGCSVFGENNGERIMGRE